MKPGKAIEILKDRLDIAMKCTKWTGGAYYEALRTAIRTMERGSGWIPVEKRLPKTEDKVLCCTRTQKGIKNIVIGYYSDRWCCGMNSNVIAWQPLPEIYEEEQDD